MNNLFSPNTNLKLASANPYAKRVVQQWNQIINLTSGAKDGEQLTPTAFVQSIQLMSAKSSNYEFAGFAQNDATEFITFLLDTFDIALRKPSSMRISGKSMNSTDKMAMSCYKMMITMYKNGYSDIIDIFYGIQVTRILDPPDNDKNVLGLKSTRPEPFAILTLNIPPRSAHRTTIMDCFNHYCRGEHMSHENGNAWYNDETKMKENIVRDTKFWSLPKIMIVALNRNTMSGRKNTTNVVVPCEPDDVLDLSNHVCGYRPDTYKYKLYAVSNHMGGARSGHYTANVKCANGKWYNCNDTNVMEIPTSFVISASAYMLFYEKVVF
jgi:ubiquitin C-terminal hydrolase